MSLITLGSDGTFEVCEFDISDTAGLGWDLFLSRSSFSYNSINLMTMIIQFLY